MVKDANSTSTSRTTPTDPVIEKKNVHGITKEDTEKNKVWAIISYLSIIGVIVVLLTEGKNSPFAKFHLNQALPLAIASLAGNAVLGMIPILGWALLPFFNLAVVILVIMGIVNAAQGEAKRLPLVGNFDLIK